MTKAVVKLEFSLLQECFKEHLCHLLKLAYTKCVVDRWTYMQMGRQADGQTDLQKTEK